MSSVHCTVVVNIPIIYFLLWFYYYIHLIGRIIIISRLHHYDLGPRYRLTHIFKLPRYLWPTDVQLEVVFSSLSISLSIYLFIHHLYISVYLSIYLDFYISPWGCLSVYSWAGQEDKPGRPPTLRGPSTQVTWSSSLGLYRISGRISGFICRIAGLILKKKKIGRKKRRIMKKKIKFCIVPIVNIIYF